MLSLRSTRKARLDGANSMILDRLMNEYITSKFKGDAKLLREELVKYELEPYKHLSIEETSKDLSDSRKQTEKMYLQ